MAPPILYYRKHAVCYADGSIKVASDKNGELVTLEINGVIIASKTLSNGAVIFENLKSGTYKVNLMGIAKEIIIQQQ